MLMSSIINYTKIKLGLGNIIINFKGPYIVETYNISLRGNQKSLPTYETLRTYETLSTYETLDSI
jgi:hypothetical protein